MKAFKQICAATLLAAFSFAVIGCEASVKAGDPDKMNNGSSSSSYEKKTVTETAPNGQTTTHTEMNKTN